MDPRPPARRRGAVSPPRQLVLDLGHRPALGREDFLVGPANAEAVGWIDRYPEWPSYGLAIVGPAGCGKSHLAQVFASRANAKSLGPAEFAADRVSSGAAYLVEDAGADERKLLHFLNAVRENNAHVLLTARAAPARWGAALPDLASRLAALPVVRISAPDDAMREAVLVKLFADRQLDVAPDVIAYLLSRMDRSFEAMRHLVARADAESLAHGRAVTVPLVKDLLADGAS